MANTYINPNAIKSNSLEFNVLIGGGDLLSRIETIERYLWPPALCDIVYWDGSKVKTVSQDKWPFVPTGIPVGVVVIPEGMLPDGKARIIGLQNHVSKSWGGYGTDTSLTNYTKVPTTDNAGSTSTGSAGYAYLPSDKFSGTVSYVDPGTQYSGTSKTMIPSPYITRDGKNEFNPEYSKVILSGDTNVNCLSDFNGLENTRVLQSLGSDYQAAQYCWSYSDGASNLQWYLPAAGELGFLVPRFNAINAAITAVGGSSVASDPFWSSSEYSSGNAYYVNTNYGTVDYFNNKFSNYFVRPFAVLERHRPTIISFRIEDKTYYCEQGMTWGEWCNSKYNINNTFTTDSVIGEVVMRDNQQIVSFQSSPVQKVDTITNTKYELLGAGSTD